MDLVAEARSIRSEISKIAEDYDERRWKESEEERKAKERGELREPEDVKETQEENLELAVAKGNSSRK